MSKFKTLLNLSVAFLLALSTSAQTAKSKLFSFTLKSGATTSAGVFKQDGTLIRAIWAGEKYAAGTFTKKWDGLDDDGKPYSSSDFQIKVLSNNIKYEWQGVVGNTLSDQRGSFERIYGMAFSGNSGFTALGYNEQQPVIYRFKTTDPQSHLPILGKGPTSYYVASDNENVYWSALDPNDNTTHFVYVTKVSDNSANVLSKAVSVPVDHSPTYRNSIDAYSSNLGNANSKAYINGIAVQQRGQYLFVSHAGLKEIHVLNKSTGALIRSIKFDEPRQLAIDANDDLWVISDDNSVTKHDVYNDGNLSSPRISLSGISTPTAVAVSPDNNTVSVVDAGSDQQVKGFSTANGSRLWTLGSQGGYVNDPLVNDYKFCFSDLRENYGSYIAYQADGSFWVGDAGNQRSQHYNKDRVFIDRIQYMPTSYSCGVDHVNTKRVFSDFLEFEVDYASKSWKFVRNWGAKVPKEKDDQYVRLKGINTLSNGRTYGMVGIGKGLQEVVELISTGLRFTGVIFGLNSQLYPSGDIYTFYAAKIAFNASWIKQTLTGFDGNNNPRYTLPAIVETTPPIQEKDPVFRGNIPTLTTGEITSTGNYITFDGNSPPQGGTGYHIGAVKNGKYMWKAAHVTHKEYSGPYPPDGSYDIGNGVNVYSGSKALVQDNIVIWGYHGEFWKNGQANMYNVLYENGLMLGQFGAIGAGQPVPGMAGNSFAGTLIKVGSDMYLYHNDESYRSGVHRWKITGLNTVELQVANLLEDGEYDEGMDLMEGLPFNSVLQNNTHGWTRYPEHNDATDIYSKYWFAKTSVQTVQKQGGRDVYANFRSSSGEAFIKRDLGSNVGLTSWTVGGKISFNGNNGNVGNFGGCFFDILDNTGKIIVRIGDERNYVNEKNITRTIWANNKPILRGLEADVLETIYNPQNLQIVEIGGTVTITYGSLPSVSAGVFEPGANWQNPKSIRLYFYSKASNYTRVLCVSDLNFRKSKEDVADIQHPDAQCPGTGSINWEHWNGIYGSKVANIPVTTTPSGSRKLTEFAIPSYTSDFYGSRLRGFICVPKSGEYTFYIAADDDGELWLSTSSKPADKKLIAFVNGYADAENYTKFPSQTSKPIYLKAGEKYYIEALQKENTGGDHLSVAWKLPAGIMESPIPGSRLIPFDFVEPEESAKISISSPANNSIITSPQIVITTNVTDVNATVNKVEFFAGNTKLGETTTKPYSFNWQNIPEGKYAIIAKAIDKSGQVINTDNIDITVNLPEATAPAAPAAACQGAGNILWEKWTNLGGPKVNKIPTSRAADETKMLTSFSIPLYSGDNYGSRVRGYLCVPKTGDYTFYISTDDDGELWLSPGTNPADKQLIASVTGYADAGNYTKFASQTSKPVRLLAGAKYYIEALQKEEQGGDHLSVAWRNADGVMEAPIPGARLIPYDAPPTVQLTSPTKDAVFTADVVRVEANVTDDAETLARVEYYSGSDKIGETTVAPHIVNWQKVKNGAYTIIAKAINKKGEAVGTDKVNVTVNVPQPTACQSTGNIVWEYWTNILGPKVNNIPTSKAPDGTKQLTSFSTPLYFGENYGSRIRAYLCVPTTGEYTFFIATDDDGELWLSKGSNPEDKELIASVSGWTEQYGYYKYASQRSKPILLKAGERYYIEALQKEQLGGDHLSVAWELPDGTFEGPIPGKRLSPYISEGNKDYQMRSSSNASVMGGLPKNSGKPNIIVTEPSLKTYPNPFVNILNIECSVPAADHYTVQIFSVQGVLLKTIFSGNLTPGITKFTFNGGNLPSGVYVCRLVSGTTVVNKQVSLIK